MFLESIGYTAMLIEYVARQTGCSVSDIATVLGRTKIFNLCHNAPMNRLLPIKQIAREIIIDNYLNAPEWSDVLVANERYGAKIEKLVDATTDDKREYTNELFDLLTVKHPLIEVSMEE